MSSPYELFSMDSDFAKMFEKDMGDILKGLEFNTVTPAATFNDLRRATDADFQRKIRVGYRCRRSQWWAKYPNDITIREARTSGAKTEKQKIIEGYVDWLLYAHCNADQTELAHWLIVNAKHLAYYIVEEHRRFDHRPPIRNPECGTLFMAYNVVTDFDQYPPILIARKPGDAEAADKVLHRERWAHLRNLPEFPGWGSTAIQDGGLVTKLEFERAAIAHTMKSRKKKTE